MQHQTDRIIHTTRFGIPVEGTGWNRKPPKIGLPKILYAVTQAYEVIVKDHKGNIKGHLLQLINGLLFPNNSEGFLICIIT